MERHPTCHCVQVTSDALRLKRVHGELRLPMFFYYRPLTGSLTIQYFYVFYRCIFVFPLETAAGMGYNSSVYA